MSIDSGKPFFRRIFHFEENHAQITTTKLVVFGLGTPTVSLPHNRERTRSGSLAHMIHDRSYWSSLWWANQMRDDINDNQWNYRIGRILGMIPDSVLFPCSFFFVWQGWRTRYQRMNISSGCSVNFVYVCARWFPHNHCDVCLTRKPATVSIMEQILLHIAGLKITVGYRIISDPIKPNHFS